MVTEFKYLIGVLFIYLITSFVSLELNPLKWDKFLRVVFGIYLIITVIAYLSDRYDKQQLKEDSGVPD
jgi:hypothetical protein